MKEELQKRLIKKQEELKTKVSDIEACIEWLQITRDIIITGEDDAGPETYIESAQEISKDLLEIAGLQAEILVYRELIKKEE